MKARNTILALVLILGGGGLLWWSGTNKAGAPGANRSFQGKIKGKPGSNVILVTLDTTRADHIGCYGGPEGITPNIDERLAAKGLRFLHASAVAPITLPSHTSMLTGLYPYHHGVRSNGNFALGEDFETLAGSFKKAGYQTAAFISASVLTRRYGLDRDFDLYDDDLSTMQQHIGTLVPSRTGNFTMDSALTWLKARDRKRSFFCWIHLYDPHAPLTPPPEFAARFGNDLYSAEIAFTDAQIGRLLDELDEEKISDETYVSIIADHGEGLGEHGEHSHAILIHEATIHVPWILEGPGLPRNAVIADPVSNADVVPTLAALAGVADPNADTGDGINVLTASALAPDQDREIVIETLLPRYQYGWSPLYGLRRGPWKLVSGKRVELFNLESDPKELEDLSSRQPELLRELETDLRPIIEAGSKDDAKISLTPGEREQLEALGYLGTDMQERSDAPDPRDLIGAHVNFEMAMNLLAQGRLDETMDALNRALTLDPTNVQALVLRARTLMQQKNFQDAREDLLKAVSLDPRNTDAYVALGNLELRTKHFKKALKIAEIGKDCRGAFESFSPIKSRALMGLGRNREAEDFILERLKIHPEDTDLMVERARQLRRIDHRPEEAEKLLRTAIAKDALSASARYQLADLLMQQGKKEEAAEVLREILRNEPGDARALSLLGKMNMAADPESSIPYLEEALRVAPEDPTKMTALGVAYIRAHRIADAESLLRKATGLDPSNPEIRNNLAILLIQQKKYDEAVEQLETVLQAHPSFVQARNNLAIAYRSQGKFDLAEKEAREAIRQRPDFLDAKLTLASLFNARKRWKDEYAVLNSLSPEEKKDPRIVLPLALAAFHTGNCPETLNVLSPALRARERLSWDIELALATCLEKGGRLDEARHHFEEAARQSPPGAGREAAQEGIERLSMHLGR